MNNPDKATVIADIHVSKYINLFENACGPIGNIDAGYDCMAEAIAAFEGSDELNKLSSKFNQVIAGQLYLYKSGGSLIVKAGAANVT